MTTFLSELEIFIWNVFAKIQHSSTSDQDFP